MESHRRMPGNNTEFVPGIVIEIDLENGRLAYLQFVGHTRFAGMVRVLKGTYATPLDDGAIRDLVDQPGAFFSQIGARGLLEFGRIRGTWHVPDIESELPDIRMWAAPSADNPRGWKILTSAGGYFTECQYSELHPEVDQSMLPLYSIPMPARLRWLIEVGWTPREAKSRRDDWWKN